MLYIVLALYAYLVFLSVGTFFAFGWDKKLARRGASRLPEIFLFWLALSGGWLGAKMGQYVYRHKKRKTTFSVALNCIPLVYICAFAAVAVTSVPL